MKNLLNYLRILLLVSVVDYGFSTPVDPLTLQPPPATIAPPPGPPPPLGAPAPIRLPLAPIHLNLSPIPLQLGPFNLAAGPSLGLNLDQNGLVTNLGAGAGLGIGGNTFGAGAGTGLAATQQGIAVGADANAGATLGAQGLGGGGGFALPGALQLGLPGSPMGQGLPAGLPLGALPAAPPLSLGLGPAGQLMVIGAPNGIVQAFVINTPTGISLIIPGLSPPAAAPPPAPLSLGAGPIALSLGRKSPESGIEDAPELVSESGSKEIVEPEARNLQLSETYPKPEPTPDCKDKEHKVVIEPIQPIALKPSLPLKFFTKKN